jgi:hypothetical protein
MPIEFRCGQCGKLLRTGDNTAGKQAKCPSCGSIQPIPMSSAPPGGAPEPLPPPGDSSPSPFGQAPLPSGFDPNPYASPSSGTAPFDVRGPSGPRTGPPWERDGPSVNSFFATLQEFYSLGTGFFTNMRRDGGIGPPFIYGLLGAFITLVFIIGYAVALQLLGFAVRMPNGMFGNQAFNPWQSALVGGCCWIVMGPVLVAIYLFVGAAVYHLLLQVFGGAPEPYETTFRVTAYSVGAMWPFAAIPLCGQYIVVVVHIVYVIIGLWQAQRVGGLKASAAVLTPWLLLCGTCIGLIFVAFQAILK